MGITSSGQKRKLRLGELRQGVQGHTATTWESWDAGQACLAPNPGHWFSQLSHMQDNFHQSHHHRRQIPMPQPPPGQGALRQVPCDVCVCVCTCARTCSSVLKVSKAGLPLCMRPAP